MVRVKKSYRKELTAAQARKLGYRFDAKEADRCEQFFLQCLRHSKGKWAGEPFTLLEWERVVVRSIFGWKRKDGTRRFRRGSIWIPKKNGKSTLCAGLSLLLLVGDKEPGAEVYSAAVDQKQAGIIYREAASMVRKSPALAKRISPIDSTKFLQVKGQPAFFHAMSSEAPTKEGVNAHAVIVDELHAHPNRELFDTLFYSGAARSQPLFLSISTAGIYNPESVGWKEYEYARRVAADPTIDPEYFAFVAEASEKDDWRKPETWRKANPSMGETIQESDMASEVNRVIEQPDMLNSFKRYRLNIWTQSESAWLPAAKWNACRFDAGIEDNAPRYVGLDLSATTDLTAKVNLWPLGDGRYRCRGHYYIPKEGLAKRELKDRVPYSTWIRDGWMTATPGDVVDYSHLRAAVRDDAAKGGLVAVGFDPWNATHLATELMEDGIEMLEVRQGYVSLNEPMKKLKELVLEGKLDHGGDPVMLWAANNVVITQDDAGNIKPSKGKAIGRIDPIVALVIAMAVCLRREAHKNVISYFEM